MRSSDSAVQQPAAGLVQLALDRWLMRGVRADNISAIVVMFLDPSENVPKPPVARSPVPRLLEHGNGRARLGRHKFCRSSLLRAALHKLWRVRATRNQVLARESTCGIRGVLLPLGTCDRLDTPPPSLPIPPIRRNFRSTTDLKAEDDAESSDEESDIMAMPENGTAKGLRRRHSYIAACEEEADDEDDESVLPKRMRCDDDIPFIDDSPAKIPSLAVRDENSTVTIDKLKEACDNKPGSLPSSHASESTGIWNSFRELDCGRDWHCRRPVENTWSLSRRNRLACVTRTRLQAQRVCDG